MTTEEGNKLIAEFMGGSQHERDGCLVWDHEEWDSPLVGRRYETGNLKYHTSWDWLMPVVEKINKWHQETLCRKTDFYLLNQSICSSKEMVWDACIEFIQWYNTQTK